MDSRLTKRLHAVASLLRCCEVEQLGRPSKLSTHHWIQTETLPVQLMLGESAAPLRADDI